MGKATNSIARKGSRGERIAPCRVKGQRPLWGLGQRPNCSAFDQPQGSHQQRRRQRSVPASNFALPQKRPQAALSINSTLSRQMGTTDQHGRRFFLIAGLFCCRDFASAEATRGLSDCPLDPFGAATFGVVCCSICSQQEIPLPECFLPNKSPGSCWTIVLVCCRGVLCSWKMCYACSNCELYSSA